VGYNYYNAPGEIKLILDEIVKSYYEILKDNLVGIYLHGSLALGCFNSKVSDIDFLIVVRDKLSLEIKREIVKTTLWLASLKDIPPKGLEFSIVLEKHLKDFIHPMPFEFHYSKVWHNAYEEDKIDLSKDNRDRDLSAHIMVIINRGISLYGKPIKEVFPQVPREYYIDALMYDVEGIINDILGDPVYGILNLCRVLCFLEEEIVASKEEGGFWGVNNLPEKYRKLISKALNVYTGKIEEANWDKEELQEFANYMVSRINSIVSHAKVEGS